jgi:hypothetical protein
LDLKEMMVQTELKDQSVPLETPDKTILDLRDQMDLQDPKDQWDHKVMELSDRKD